MRIALLADLHGNLPALEAVIHKLEHLQPDIVVLDGDLINGVPFSTEVIDLVRRLDWVAVRGNHEFYYLDFGTPRAEPGSEDPRRWGQLHWLAQRITPSQGAYLAMLPDLRTFYLPGTQPLCITHGVPGRNRIGFYNEQSEANIVAELEAVNERTLISAHTHVQVDRHVSLADAHKPTQQRWHVINPGSVGLPLNGDVQAQFAMIEAVPDSVVPGGWQATMYRVPYDRRPALAAYTDSGMASAGGAMSELFYWEVVTAKPEVVFFFRWAAQNRQHPEANIEESFSAYRHATGRDRYVRERDPLFHRGGQ
jgi:predicted phosphodiesterase